MNWISFFSFMAAFLSLQAGFRSFKSCKITANNLLFFIVTLFFFLWSSAFGFFYMSPTMEQAKWWIKVVVISYSAALVFILIFVYEMAHYKNRVLKIVLYSVTIFLTLIVCLSALQEKLISGLRVGRFGWHVEINITNINLQLTLLLIIIHPLFILGGLLGWWRRSRLIKEKRQALVLLSTLLASYLISTIYTIVFQVLQINEMPQVSHIFNLIFILGVYYSMNRYNLFAQRSELIFTSLLYNIFDFLFILDREGRVEIVNSRVAAGMELNEEELRGRSFLEFIDDESSSFSLSPLDRERRVYNIHLKIYRSRVPVQIISKSLFDRYDDHVGYLIIAHDERSKELLLNEINTRISTERALYWSEIKLCSIINSINEAIFVVNNNYEIISYNRVLSDYLESINTSKDILHRNIQEAFPFIKEKELIHYKQAFQDGKIYKEVTRIGDDRSGQVIESSLFPILEGGKVTALLTVVREISSNESFRD